MPPRPIPLLPPRKDTLSSTPPKKVELPTANWGALWDIVKPRPRPAKPTPAQKGSGSGELISISPPNNEDPYSYSNHNRNLSSSDSPITKLRPDLPPIPGKIELEAFTNPYASMAPPVPVEWSPFFQADGTQNAIFVDLMTTIFLHLDVENTDSLSPEVYSAFLEMQGVPMEDNIWQKTLFAEGGVQNQEIADLELGIFYKNHEIQHTLAVRHAAHLPPPSPSPTAGERIRRSISLGANMPMLSRQGFIDVMGMELLQDPDEGHKRLGGVVRDYEVWKELGEIPRKEGGGGEEDYGGDVEGGGEEVGMVGSSDGNDDLNADTDAESNMPAPDSFTFETTDDEEKLTEEKGDQVRHQAEHQVERQMEHGIQEVRLSDAYTATIKKIPVVIEPVEETNWV
ncbi:hypothetical protein EYC80_007848 [Monilinia laxa]|uniref:DUF7514 domain-containing protein n=1 Tax=Monilinia laxa TaxID=61186 RepID=A0A5N6JSQ4_MONLA|nr:hypothetical protein EYC80_007848 [Monilinia laxa]